MVHIILCKKSGQLGNRLFHYASFIAFAHLYNVKIYYPALEDYAHLFKNYESRVLPSFPSKSFSLPLGLAKLVRIIVFHFFYYLERVLDKTGMHNSRFHQILDINPADNSTILNKLFFNSISKKRIVFVKNWLFICDEFTDPAQNSIKLATQFLPKYYKEVDTHINRIHQESAHIVGVHIRRTDYVHFEEGKYFYTLKNYIDWMHEVDTLLLGKVIFLISSDESLLKENSLAESSLTVHFAIGNLIQDLILLSKCDYIIGPPSTFSMWASFMGKTPLHMLRAQNQKIELKNFKTYKFNEAQP